MSRTVIYPHYSGDLVVEFDYQPKENATLEYPGCDEDVDIVSVRAVNNTVVDILDVCSRNAIALIKEYCIEFVHNEIETNLSKNEE
jgi:hypothetical protein